MPRPDSAEDRDALVEELRAAVAARDNFIAVATHELRNPMTPIVGQVELLLGRARREGASAATITGLERLEISVSHYVRRATALLEISRVNSGRLVLEPTTFDMAAFVAQITTNYEMLATRAGSVLRCDAQGPTAVMLDQLATEQIIDNLISNAIRYGDGKPILVTLVADGSGVTLRVADAGIGIAADDRDRIFDRFERAIGSRRASGGFGIGLWLVRELTLAMGGKIDVNSAESEGSTFTVWLPRRMKESIGMEQVT